MAYTFGRLIAAGPLPLRGPHNVVPPSIVSAFVGVPVVYDGGEWTGFGPVTITARVFSAGVALPDEGGMAIPGEEHATVYLVVTATDDTGIAVQLTSEPAEVRPPAVFPVIVVPPLIVSARAGRLAAATYGAASVGQIEAIRWLLGDDVISINAVPLLSDEAAGAILTLEVVWENIGARTIAHAAPKVVDLPLSLGVPSMVLESGEPLLLESGEYIILESEA
ncbi:MAG: hypothetical protein QM699_07795 [Amaricoccus sp.]|uniref:hypothetical protein n=1 Tax=Amaricoccus sp. TaxID=1872485 RepID=UPI0039E2E944